MHNAPSVSYPVGRSRNAERLLLALWLMGAVTVGAACVQSPGTGWREAVLGLCALIAAGGAWWARLPGAANLAFDGQYWTVSGSADSPMGRAGVMLDLQALLLVRFTEPTGRARWLWAERRSLPERWRDLRRALYSRASPVEADGQPPNSTHVQHFSP